MNPPAWLAEFHRQWTRARGGRPEPSRRAFSRPWEDLLDAAGLHGAAERSHAESEARRLAAEGRVTLRTHKYRTYRIDRIAVPVDQEAWLAARFGTARAGDLQAATLAVVEEARAVPHARWPESWDALCAGVAGDVSRTRIRAPFSWKNPAETRRWFGILRGITSRDWPAGTLLRNVSEELAGDSKFLERRQARLEAGLRRMLGPDTSIETLGIAAGRCHATLQGPLVLHFADGPPQEFFHLRGPFTVSLEDLRRACRATTPASRILSIENHRTTFRQAAAANIHGDTLVVATSYPNAATRRLLALLPAEVPHHHFGDTDPAGYAILLSLRALGVRRVDAWRMDWQDQDPSPPLTEFDRRLLPALQQSPLLADCAASLAALASAGRKGRFEQEKHGPPTLEQWPFWAGPAL